jgi:hypothetical protein
MTESIILFILLPLGLVAPFLLRLMVNAPQFCFFGNHDWKWVRNLYGDQINRFGGRSIWRCRKCGKTRPRQFLVEESEPQFKEIAECP